MLLRAVLILYAVASLVALVTYGLDKSSAVHGRRRVRERTLHLMELFGGWPGALLAQALFRHKRRKSSYMVVFTLIVVLHAGCWIAWLRYS